MKKDKLEISKQINKISVILIFFLLVSNIILINTHNMTDPSNEVEQTVYFTPTDKDYKEKTKYYAEINYKKFKKLYKANKISTIAVVDSKSNVSNMFISMINKIAYYKHTKIYVVKINKLSNKDVAAFYNLDDKLKDLESNYIITVSSNKIISTTSFDEENINLIEKELGE